MIISFLIYLLVRKFLPFLNKFWKNFFFFPKFNLDFENNKKQKKKTNESDVYQFSFQNQNDYQTGYKILILKFKNFNLKHIFNS